MIYLYYHTFVLTSLITILTHRGYLIVLINKCCLILSAYSICRILPSKAQNILSFESGSPVNATSPLEFINVTVYNTTHEYTTYK